MKRQRTPKPKLDITKRKICLAILQAQNVMMWHLWAEYDRMLRWYSGGLTEKERVYLQRRSVLMKDTCDDLTMFQDRLYQHLYGTTVTKQNHAKRVEARRRTRSARQ
jgi:hypothetical protein